MSSCSDRQYFAQTLRSVALPYAFIPLLGSRARPLQKYMYLEAGQYKAGTRAKQGVLGSGMRLKLGSNSKLGRWSLADGHKSPIGWPVGIRHM